METQTLNALKTMLFILAVPGFVLFVVPVTFILPVEKNAIDLGPFAWAALPLWVIGLASLLWCAGDFVRKGRGTPAPIDPPKLLVVSGLYRHVRNPMYLGVLAFATGQALWRGSPFLFGYVLLLWVIFHLFILLYEEPHLRKTFGPAYLDYCQAVPRWLPRLKRAATKNDKQP
jgi:protein-S-isoprenylcysteine O-methyltransferase Ste14